MRLDVDWKDSGKSIGNWLFGRDMGFEGGLN